MVHLTVAAWFAAAVVGLISTLLLRLTVRLIAKGTDNGWDNALTYGAVLVGLSIFTGWGASTGGVFFLLITPLFWWFVQTIALRFIYEVRTLQAWLIGVVHTLLTSMAVTALGLMIAVIAAYVLYGRIISDPMFLIRLILRLIGIELPFIN